MQSLKNKKFREIHGCFVAEGTKLVQELSNSQYSIRQVFAVTGWLPEHPITPDIPVEEVQPHEMARITALSTPSPVLAVVEIPQRSAGSADWKGNLLLMLDGIQDPGNMGTIVRIADWFGIRDVICSPGCVDLYNPKVVQATMGSIARVRVSYSNLSELLSEANDEVPVFGMMLDGEDIHSAPLSSHGILVIGSEAHGISEEVSTQITHRLSIPFYPKGRSDHAESLNAAVATGIACAEFRKRQEVKVKM